MDANVTEFSLEKNVGAWFVRMCEQTLRGMTMFLVLTGQMLPSGAVTADDDPPSPTFSSPVSATAPAQTEDDDALPAPKEDDAITPELADEPASEPDPSADPAEKDVPTTDQPVPADESVPDGEEVAEPMPAHDESAPAEEAVPQKADDAESDAEQVPLPVDPESVAPSEAAPAASVEEATDAALPVIEPAISASQSSGENTFTFDGWTVVVRPGPTAPRPAPLIQAPIGEFSLPQNNVNVPVNVNVNQINQQSDWAGWGAPWAYPAYWTEPTSAYLFQRPQPYWQLRQDFYHLRPFISGLW